MLISCVSGPVCACPIIRNIVALVIMQTAEKIVFTMRPYLMIVSGEPCCLGRTKLLLLLPSRLIAFIFMVKLIRRLSSVMIQHKSTPIRN